MKEFYISQLEDIFIPYWEKFNDDEFGGVLNCINNYGDTLLSENKFTWSQGRYLWVLCKMYEFAKKGVLRNVDAEKTLQRMKKTYRFICNHSLYDNSKCCFVLSRSGEKIEDERTGRYDASIFADCFALIGLSQYGSITKDESCIQTVALLYESIINRIAENNYLTEPYPVPDGYSTHSIPMILVNSVHEFIKMREAFNLNCEEERAYVLEQVKTIFTKYYDNGTIREFVSNDSNFNTKLLDRHINPGHTLEDMWFIVEFLQDYGNLDMYLKKIAIIVKNTFSLGWDTQYGGLLRFVDKEGGKPKGDTNNDPYETLIENTWDMKLWWPHSEMLYTFLLLHNKTNDEEYMHLYKKVYDYTFALFPNKEIGEWIQIRKRDGTAEEKVVALPVKDPFHIMRNFIKIIELYTN